MYPIPEAVYRQRLARVRRMPGYRRVASRERTHGVVEHWADGCCQLRALVYRDGWEAYGRKGIPGTKRPEDFGRISFKTWKGSDVPRPEPPPPPPDVIDWAE